MKKRSAQRWLLRSSLLVALATASSASVAQPQPAPTTVPATPPPPPPSAQDAAAAKRNFEIGLRLYAEGAYEQALAEFEASYRLGGRPSALKNIAQCHRDMKHFAEAYEAYERMLNVHAAQLKDAEKDVVKRTLSELSVLTAQLKITSNEDGAAVELDGKPLGTTPLATPKRVGLGGHQVKVTKAGFEPFQKDLAVSSEQVVDVSAALAKEVTTGHLAVREQNGDEVHVFIDGEDKGPAPWEGELAPGDHTVEAKGSKFVAEKRAFTIAKKERLDLVLDATTALGHIRVTTVPVSATILVDGSPVGTGVWDGDVMPGMHHLEVFQAGLPKATRDVVIMRGQVMVQEIPLAVAGLAGESAPDYRGMYARISLHWGFSPTQTHYDPNTPGVSGTDKNFLFAPSAQLRIGYSFDIFALEFVSSFMLAHFDDKVHVTPQGGGGTGGNGDLRYNNTSVNGFFGVGGRVTSHDSTVRFTFGIAPGLVVRSFAVDRSLDSGCPSSGCGQDFNSNSGYTAPGLLLDGGMLLGNTPGAKFFLGVHAWLDFAPELVVGPDSGSALPNEAFPKPGRGYVVVSGPQFFIGPSLGVQFGH